MSVDIIAETRNLLQDTDVTNLVWPTTVLESFRDAATRRLSPVCGRRAATEISYVPNQTEYSLDTLLSCQPLEVEDIVFNTYGEDIGWNVYGDVLTLDVAPIENFIIKAVLPYTAYTQLPDSLADAVVLGSCGRALDWLLRRGGKALQRYLVDQGELQAAEVRGLAQFYHDEFSRYREEWATGTSRGLG
jgi:hypothetical protein